MEHFSYKNIMQVPRLEKVINKGIGEGKDNPKLLDIMVKELSLITDKAYILM